MTAAAEVDCIELRVVIVEPSSHRLAVLQSSGAFGLLRVSVPRKARYARHLQIAVRHLLNLTVLVVEFLSIEAVGPTCVVVELLTAEIPTSCRLVDVDDLQEGELSSQERSQLLLILGVRGTTSVSSIGWIDEAIGWVESTVGASLQSRESLEQYSGGRDYALIRFLMRDGRLYWLKATGWPNTHERTLAQALSHIGDPCVPRVVADRPDWNAWLMTGDGRPLSALPTEPEEVRRLFGYAVSCLAELQKRSLAHTEALLTAGAFDQRPRVLRAHFDGLFTHIAEALSWQPPQNACPVARSRLAEIRQLLEKLFDRLERLDIPVAILHGDINQGNVLFTGEQCQFTDWSDGFIGLPFIALEHLLLLNRIESPRQKEAVNEALRQMYRLAFSGICDQQQTNLGMTCAPLVAAISALYGRGDWLHAATRNEPRRLTYARSMARHIDCAAQYPALLQAMNV
jgi:hypothetical protein